MSDQHEIIRRRINHAVSLLLRDGIELANIGSAFVGIGGAILNRHGDSPSAFDEAISAVRDAISDHNEKSSSSSRVN